MVHGWHRFVMWGECVVWDSVLWMGGMGACMEKACEVGSLRQMLVRVVMLDRVGWV
jgi:hypothetical protein